MAIGFSATAVTNYPLDEASHALRGRGVQEFPGLAATATAWRLCRSWGPGLPWRGPRPSRGSPRLPPRGGHRRRRRSALCSHDVGAGAPVGADAPGQPGSRVHALPGWLPSGRSSPRAAPNASLPERRSPVEPRLAPPDTSPIQRKLRSVDRPTARSSRFCSRWDPAVGDPVASPAPALRSTRSVGGDAGKVSGLRREEVQPVRRHSAADLDGNANCGR